MTSNNFQLIKPLLMAVIIAKQFKSIIGLTFKGIVKKAKSCKYNILLVSRILQHKRIIPSLKEWRFSYISVIIASYKIMQWHSSEGCLFSLEKTSDIEC